MLRLTGQADHCRQLATRFRREAKTLKDPIFRNQMLRLAKHWAELAESYDLAEDVSGFLQWDARRLLPPEAFRG